MDTELKNNWIQALRSGKYKQGRSFLKQEASNNTYHCCLGVLCELMGLDQFKVGNEIVFKDYENQEMILKLSLDLVNNIQMGFGDQLVLSYKNDNGKSFNEIADWIEKNL